MDYDSDAKQLQCMEIVGGNQAVRQAVRSPGLDVWVESRPHNADAGGDIHYFSMCGSGRVTASFRPWCLTSCAPRRVW